MLFTGIESPCFSVPSTRNICINITGSKPPTPDPLPTQTESEARSEAISTDSELSPSVPVSVREHTSIAGDITTMTTTTTTSGNRESTAGAVSTTDNSKSTAGDVTTTDNSKSTAGTATDGPVTAGAASAKNNRSTAGVTMKITEDQVQTTDKDHPKSTGGSTKGVPETTTPGTEATKATTTQLSNTSGTFYQS